MSIIILIHTIKSFDLFMTTSSSGKPFVQYFKCGGFSLFTSFTQETGTGSLPSKNYKV